jgi:CHAT domain-containing protein
MVPSGDMHLLSFDSFPLRGGVLLGDKYSFVRLSSAKEILSGVSAGFEVKKAVLYGGLQYDMTEDDRVTEAKKYEKSWRHLTSRWRSGSAADRFHNLPMSRKEVVAVSELLNAKGVDTRCFMGQEGTEESFVGMDSPSPDIIHIATHGFYYTPEEASDVRGLSGYKDAMRLSGLVMSGGNAEWLGENIPENTLGGILTADDISICDLSGTDLVVLTACDTGKGRVTTEGVYGLQRAFKKAGAKTIVMSLWKVDDKAVTDFTDYFYTSLTTNGWNKREAFRSAKNQLHEKYRSPYYWAGFFMLD